MPCLYNPWSLCTFSYLFRATCQDDCFVLFLVLRGDSDGLLAKVMIKSLFRATISPLWECGVISDAFYDTGRVVLLVPALC
jgi:hypothetical protein